MEIRPSNIEANPQCLDCVCLSDESWGTTDEGVALEMSDLPMVRNTTEMQTDSGGEQITAAADDDTSTDEAGCFFTVVVATPPGRGRGGEPTSVLASPRPAAYLPPRSSRYLHPGRGSPNMAEVVDIELSREVSAEETVSGSLGAWFRDAFFQSKQPSEISGSGSVPSKPVPLPPETKQEDESEHLTFDAADSATSPPADDLEEPVRLGRWRSLSSTSSRSFCDQMQYQMTRKRMVLNLQLLQVCLITLVMGSLEIGDRILLLVFLGSLLVVLALNVWLAAHHTGVVILSAVVLFFFGAFSLTMYRIDEMERHSKKFEKADDHVLGGLAGDQLGPQSIQKPNLEQRSSMAQLPDIMTRASALKEIFDTEVVQVLAKVGEARPTGKAFPTLGPNLKGMERAQQKVSLEYGGNAARLKDVLRCSIVCDDMKDLTRCYATLIELEKKCILSIEQVTKGAGR